MKYDFKKIEKKWNAAWEKEGIYEPQLRSRSAKGKPFYNLMMFPYPSAEGLHIGGVRTFTGVDIYGRLKRMQGYDVFQPIGLDGFGINAENYALKIGKHPLKHSKITEKNFYRQLRMIGNGFSWDEKLETYDPEYYKWTQWIFTQMFKWGLAYRKKQAVNWCPSCKTVLADEQVIAGKCERCGSVVEKKELEQWFFRITKYADRLVRNLEKMDWTADVKLAQKNWIGRSEGALIEFPITNFQLPIEVFTTRPDTLFGATYLVLAPEHEALKNLEHRTSNFAEVQKYIEANKDKAEEERIAEDREKTGVELKGIKAINPATGEEIPVWVADYVLGNYGTGAIMAVPAHDERDHAFAKKYNLNIRPVIEPVTGVPHGDDHEKEAIVAIVRNPKTNQTLMLDWGPRHSNWGGMLFVGGGVDPEEDIIKAAVREITEETGYANVRFVRQTEVPVNTYYFSNVKNRHDKARMWGLLFELIDDEQVETRMDEGEKNKFKVSWVADEKVFSTVDDEGHRLLYEMLTSEKVYTGEGVLMNSGKFDGLPTAEAKSLFAKEFGTPKVQYRLRDWLLSRQRYWGAPIPMIFCEACAGKGKGERKDMPGWYTVKEKELPVKLPNVKDFRPKGTGQSPLAAVKSFYEVPCPACRSKARRETDVCDTFIDSSWYFLRYPSARDKKHAWDPAVTKRWLPVTSYIGGKEHSVLHLLYSRFLTMAFKDHKLTSFEEPFARFRAHGLITKDGAKMSKSKGNVVNPDEYWKVYGADVMRMYLAFMAPLDQGGDFRDAGIIGLERFLSKIWRFVEDAAPRAAKKPSKEEQRIMHRTIKKVGEDIEDLKYNTAISALMIALGDLEKREEVGRETLEQFVLLVAPFAPFMAEELWRVALKQKGSVHVAPWPKFNKKFLTEDTFLLIVQVNGKTRASISAPAGISEADAKALALGEAKIKAEIGEKEIRRVIYIPNRLINLVV